MTLYDYAMRMVGVPYISAGNSPVGGLDCSGLVCELLKSQGLLRAHEDLTAQDIYKRFYQQSRMNVRGLGALAFYGKNDVSIEHVALMLDDKTIVEAGGGDSTTTSVQEAIKRNAFVRLRALQYRGDFLCTLMPI